eukprot:Rmarinus@m.4936
MDGADESYEGPQSLKPVINTESIPNVLEGSGDDVYDANEEGYDSYDSAEETYEDLLLEYDWSSPAGTDGKDFTKRLNAVREGRAPNAARSHVAPKSSQSQNDTNLSVKKNHSRWSCRETDKSN